LCVLFVSQGKEQASHYRGNYRGTIEEKETRIKTLLWNIEGLKNAINMIPDDTFDTYDLVSLIETFLTSQWSTDNFYSVHSYTRQGERGRLKGGITMLINSRLAPFETLLNTKNTLLVKTKLCTVMNVYFQPEYKADEILEEIDHALSMTNDKGTVIIMGDLNCRVDAPTQKTETVVNHIEKEGLILINDRKEKTYFGPMGPALLTSSSQTATRPTRRYDETFQ
ncbi:hypothetical protein ANN_17599, partial [Periplaneta americana]